IKGCTLRERLRRERARRGGATPTTEAEVRVLLDLLAAAGAGLIAAHQAGLVHRDFKPDNVLVSDEGRVCVVDFGLVALTSRDVPAALLGETTSDGVRALDLELTEAGAILGTLAYMSPEQLRGLPSDALSDQFSFSIALFEALHGKRPFSGSSRAELRANVAEGRRADVRRNRAVPGWIQEAVERGLAVDPRDRWPSMEALLEALRRSPTRRRKRLVSGLLLAATAIAAPLSYGAVEERREVACERLAAEAVAPWTEHRPEIRAGLIASGAPFAPPTASWVERQLDTWTAAWQDARVEACVDPGESGSYEARRGLCLDRQAARMRSLLPLFRDADQTTIQHAAVAAASLPEVSRCVDPVWLSTELRAEASPATQAGIEALRARLLAATSHEITGSLGRGLEIAEAALVDARELADPELLAEALLTAGRLRLYVVAPEDAAALLADAYFLAGEIGHQRVCAEAAVLMISAVGFHLARTAEGLAWGRHALMWLDHLGIRDAMINADYHNHIGINLVRSGPQAGAEALEHFSAALAILEAALGDAHPLVAGAHNNVGFALDAMERRDEALQHYRRAVEITEELFGPVHPDAATGRTNIASIHLYAGDHARALAEFERALEVRRATLGPDHLDVADSLGNIGFVLRQLGRHDEALARFRESLRIREAQLDPAHPDIALSLQSIGATLVDAGDPEAALPPLERALTIREASEGADHSPAGESHLTLAHALLDLGRTDAAVDHLDHGA
ncbi:MAG: serine/threonine protein kinase, partial [Myxococcales bacterium]|nr:serine/threonine protein kinase [Myxococcales bacterium]